MEQNMALLIRLFFLAFFNKLEFTDLAPMLPINAALFNLYMRPN